MRITQRLVCTLNMRVRNHTVKLILELKARLLRRNTASRAWQACCQHVTCDVDSLVCSMHSIIHSRIIPSDQSYDTLHTSDLYDTIIFLVCVYLMGQFASRALKMPNLVGEIVAGILLGPPLADIVPNPEAWVLLGEIGLILLVVEAGIDIDVSTLKLIGTRGFLIAFIGSVLPIGIGIVLAIALQGTSNIKSSIAAGAVFGPTSLGIGTSCSKPKRIRKNR